MKGCAVLRTADKILTYENVKNHGEIFGVYEDQAKQVVLNCQSFCRIMTFYVVTPPDQMNHGSMNIFYLYALYIHLST